MGKGQVGLFIAIGLVIVIVIGLLLFARTYFVEEGLEQDRYDSLSEDTKSVKNFVDECLYQTLSEGIYFLGTQGGFVYLPDNYAETDYSNIAYSYYKNNITLISLESMEDQLSEYVKVTLFYCVGDFSTFPGNITYDLDTIEAETIIGKDDVTVNLELDVRVKDSIVDEFSAIVPLYLGDMHDIVYTIAEKTQEEPEWIDMSYLSEISLQGYETNVFPEDDDIIYSISQGDFTFLTAVNIEKNQEPVIYLSDEIVLEKNVQWNYTILYEDDGFVSFSDDTAMFDITNNGEISFTPEIKGEFNVTITATDDYNAYDSVIVKFIVE